MATIVLFHSILGVKLMSMAIRPIAERFRGHGEAAATESFGAVAQTRAGRRQMPYFSDVVACALDFGADRMRLAPVLLLLSLLSACALFGGPKYVVFFEEGSAQLDQQAQSVISGAAARANRNPVSSVMVIGYTDSAGSPPADVALSQQRAQTVADALAAHGVAVNRLVREGRGPTGQNPGIASRRVEIVVGGRL